MRTLFMISLVWLVFSAVPAQAEPLLFLTQDFPPFTYLIDDRPSGPGVEIVTSACRLEGLECEVDLLPWPRAQMLVREGEAHGLFLLGMSADREKWLVFSKPIVRTGYAFFERAGEGVLETKGVEGLEQGRVGVYGPSNTSRSLAAFREEKGAKFKIDMTPDDEEAFKKLSWGRVDAVFSNSAVGKALVAKLHLTNVVPSIACGHLNYYIACSRDSDRQEELRRFMDRVADMVTNGTVDLILARYYLEGEGGGE